MTEDIIIQSEPEKQDKNQILEKKFWNLSDFDLKTLQRVRFWIRNFTTLQILKQNNFLKSTILKKKYFKKHDFEEKIIFKKHDLEEKIIFKKHDFEKKLHTKIQVLIQFTP